MKKRCVSLLLFSALLTALCTGCGNSSVANESQSPAADAAVAASESDNVTNTEDKNYLSTYDVASEGDVTLDVMITSLGDSDGGPFLRNVMNQYMELYPNVTLNPVECSMNNLYTTLITQSTSGTLPDIFTMSEAFSQNCYDMGMAVSNIDELLGEEYVSEIADAAIECATIDDTLVYMPWQNNTGAVVYRKDLYEEKGLSIPTTWEEFIANAKALTEDLDGDGQMDRYGVVLAGTRNDSAEARFQTLALTFGCDFVTENGDGTFTSGFSTDEFKNAMQSFVDMAVNDGINPPGFVETGYSEAYTLLASDKACMFFSGSNVLGGIFGANPDMKGKFGSFPMPTADGVDPVTAFSSVGMTISATSKHPEVAADFLKYLTSVENSVTWNEATYRLPVIKSALSTIVEKDDSYEGYEKALPSAVNIPSFAGLAELRDAAGECWQRIISEGVPVEDAVKDAAEKADKIASSYSK